MLYVLIALGLGFGLGRIHSLSSLKAKIAKLESTLTADEKLVSAKVKALIGKL